ncbi:MAG: ABC transporter ATP-binding protein [Butyrivibrio sp.]
MIELSNVRKTFDGKRYVIDGLSIRFQKGEFVQIIGKSGAGKSTLLNLIGLLDRQYEGRICIDGRDISKLSDIKISNIRSENIGFIFQSYNLINHMTAKENIYMPLLYSRKGLDREYIARIEGLMEELEISDLANTQIQYLSGGEKQRVSIARALSLEPNIILADEPTGNLDPGNSNVTFNVLKKLANEGKTIILVTHDLHDELGADRILTLQDGELR